jgi:hypothetical protein
MPEPIPAPSRIDAIQRKLMLGIAGLVVLISHIGHVRGGRVKPV